jgi:hypothetical protein
MSILQSTPQRLIVRCGSRLNQTTLTLDRIDQRASIERVILFWHRRPLELPLADIEDIAVTSMMDPASGAEIFQPVVRTHTGQTIALPNAEKAEAEDTARHVRSFLGLH